MTRRQIRAARRAAEDLSEQIAEFVREMKRAAPGTPVQVTPAISAEYRAFMRGEPSAFDELFAQINAREAAAAIGSTAPAGVEKEGQ